jgi:hypothetical protein
VVRFFITVVVVLAAVLLWSFAAALLMRLFGARLPLLPFTKSGKRALKLLTFSQSVCYGVLVQGCGMFIAMTLFEYLSWRYWHVPSKNFSMTIRVDAVLWPLFGLFVGLLDAGENRSRRTSLELSNQLLKEVSDWDKNGFPK